MEMSFLQTLEQTNRYRIEGNTKYIDIL
ncbi:MAG: hypothetical protein ACK4K5_10565 [Thermosynechococcus sp.]